MSTGSPSSRRAIAPRHVVGAVIVMGILVAIIWLVVLMATPPEVLSDQQFAALTLGQTRSDIEHAIGPPKKDPKPVQPAGLLPGMTCTYYDGTSPSESRDIPSYVRLCYTNDVLSSKIQYSSVYGPTDQPSLTPSPS
jgi:hypothetical protein